jgi:hypothetical protein
MVLSLVFIFKRAISTINEMIVESHPIDCEESSCE